MLKSSEHSKLLTEVNRLNKIIPGRLRIKYRVTQYKLLIIVFLWFVIGSYSLIATSYGYNFLHLGYLSWIIALGSQVFTMIYAIPEIDSMIRKGAIYFWILLCFIAHLISFVGSVYYHYMRMAEYNNENIGDATNYQMQIVREIQNKIKFNTSDYQNFLTGLKNYYKEKANSSENGLDASSIKLRGPRTKLFENIADEIDNEIKGTPNNNNNNLNYIMGNDINISEFNKECKMLSDNILHSYSRIDSIKVSSGLYRKLIENKPGFDFVKNEKLPNNRFVRDSIKLYINRYPFVKIQIPYDELTCASNEIFRRTISLELISDEKKGFDFKVGIIMAFLIEIVMFTINMFFLAQEKERRLLSSRRYRIQFLLITLDETSNTIARFAQLKKSFNQRNLKLAVTMLSMAINLIQNNLKHNEKLTSRKYTNKLIDYNISEEDDNLNVIYYKIDDEWIKTLNKIYEINKEIFGEDLIYYSENSKRIWDYSILLLSRKLLSYFMLSGEYIIYENNHWIDLNDFFEWLSIIKLEVNSQYGFTLPELSRRSYKINIDELIKILDWE